MTRCGVKPQLCSANFWRGGFSWHRFALSFAFRSTQYIEMRPVSTRYDTWYWYLPIPTQCPYETFLEQSRMIWPSVLWLSAELQKENTIWKCERGQKRHFLKVAFHWRLLWNCRGFDWPFIMSSPVRHWRIQDFILVIVIPTRLRLTARIKAGQQRLPHWATPQRKRIHYAHSALLTALKNRTSESSHAAIPADQSWGSERK